MIALRPCRLVLIVGCATLVAASCAAPRAERPAPSATATLPAPTATPKTDARREVKVLRRASFAAVGDVLPHGAVKDAAKAAGGAHEGWSALLAPLGDGLARADVAFANLETPVAPKTDRGSRPFVFNAPPAMLDALKDAGVDVLSFANNHVYDQGREGFAETLDELDRVRLPGVGAGRTCDEAKAARVIEVNGLSIALIGSTRLFNDDQNRGPDEACAYRLDEASTLAEVARVRAAGAHAVVLSVHWGVEYVTAPRAEEVALAHRLLDGGVDVILGHHPHVLQPVELYPAKDGRLTLVAYSLGNFISNQSRFYAHGVQPEKMGNPRDGLLLRFAFVEREREGVRVTELSDVRAEILWTDNNALERARDPRLPVKIAVVSVDRELERVRQALGSAATDAEKVELSRRLQLLEDRRRIAGAIVGEDLLP